MPIIDAYMYYTAYRFQLSAQVSAILTSVTVLWKTINLSSLRLLSMPLLYLAGNLVLVHEITMIDLAKNNQNYNSRTVMYVKVMDKFIWKWSWQNISSNPQMENFHLGHKSRV